MLRENGIPAEPEWVPPSFNHYHPFHALPLQRQADLLLLLRAAPHRFPRPAAAALLCTLAAPSPSPELPLLLGAALLQQLAAEALGNKALPGLGAAG